MNEQKANHIATRVAPKHVEAFVEAGMPSTQEEASQLLELLVYTAAGGYSAMNEDEAAVRMLRRVADAIEAKAKHAH